MLQDHQRELLELLVQREALRLAILPSNRPQEPLLHQYWLFPPWR